MSIVCTNLSFSWPDGSSVVDGIDAAFGAGRTGLIGVNGSGKSTLLKLIAGELRPAAGTVKVTGELGYLPQDLNTDTSASVAELLGIAAAMRAVLAIEAGDVSEENFAAVGDDWDAADRGRQTLDRLGLTGVGLDDTVGRLSGGEVVLVALAAILLRQPDVLLLDEPTNNLDGDARRRLYAAVAGWTGTMVIVSHDRELLGMVDQVAELSDGELRMFGGNLLAYEEQLAAEQEAAERDVAAAAADVRRQQRDIIESQVKQSTRDRQGRAVAASGSLPRILAGARRRHAQESAGKSRQLHAGRLAAARDRLSEAQQAVRADARIRVDLPGTTVPAGRTVLELTGLTGLTQVSEEAVLGNVTAAGEQPVHVVADLIIRGPERVALTGPNGAGKTTLLRAIASGDAPARSASTVGYLPQRLDILDDRLSVLDNVRKAAPDAAPQQVRAGLARFLFRGDRVGQLAGSLSGGERFRAVLAALLLAEPPPQLLLLDEPTNSLDMASVRQLASALECYRGALLVASHDVSFLSAIGITRWLRVTRTVTE